MQRPRTTGAFFLPAHMSSKRVILDHEGIHRAIIRIAHEILERNTGTKDIALIGIRSRGVFLAERLQKQIRAIEHVEVSLGILDITFYRDDLGKIGPHPEIRETREGRKGPDGGAAQAGHKGPDCRKVQQGCRA